MVVRRPYGVRNHLLNRWKIHAAFPVKAAGVAMRRRYKWILAGHRTPDHVALYKENTRG
ncbi:MAG: hypothetical protein H7145_15085 [Akkermansiaceae bacterium]|nr:hypothetical protein [Armatimonadota bacterium]